MRTQAQNALSTLLLLYSQLTLQSEELHLSKSYGHNKNATFIMALTCYVPHLQSDRCARSKVTNNYAAFLVVVSDEDYDESQKYIQEKIIVTLPYLASSHKPQGKTSANSETSG